MAVKKSTLIRRELGDNAVFLKAKRLEDNINTMIMLAKDSIDLGSIYDARSMTALNRVLTSVQTAKNRTYWHNVNEFEIDKSKLLFSDVADAATIKRNINLIFSTEVDKIFNLIHQNKERFSDDKLNLTIVQTLDCQYHVDIRKTETDAFHQIYTLDICNNSITQSEFLGIIKNATYHQDEYAYTVLTTILFKLHEYLRNQQKYR